MMQKIKTAVFYLCIGTLLTFGSYYLKSTFLPQFLMADLLTILIALLAINIATLGIVFSKLEEIAVSVEEKTGTRPSFEKTQREAFASVKEQMWMIGITVVVSILCSSSVCEQYIVLKYITQTILATVLVWDLFVLYDTSSSVFKVLNLSYDFFSKPKQ